MENIFWSKFQFSIISVSWPHHVYYKSKRQHVYRTPCVYTRETCIVNSFIQSIQAAMNWILIVTGCFWCLLLEYLSWFQRKKDNGTNFLRIRKVYIKIHKCKGVKTYLRWARGSAWADNKLSGKCTRLKLLITTKIIHLFIRETLLRTNYDDLLEWSLKAQSQNIFASTQ